MTEQPKNIRVALKQDQDRLFVFLRDAHADNGQFKINNNKVWALIRRATEKSENGTWQGGFIGIIENQKEIEGAVGLFVDTFWYSDEMFLSEYFCFVREAYRRSTNAKDLLTFAKWSAEMLKLPLHVGVLTRDRLAAKERLYSRILPKMGSLFVYTPEGSPGAPDSGAV